MSKKIYIVYSGKHPNAVIEGTFEDKEVVEKFMEAFNTADIRTFYEEETLYSEFPKLYQYECVLDLETGKEISVSAIKPTLNSLIIGVGESTLHAMGETKAEARYQAEAYWKKIQQK